MSRHFRLAAFGVTTVALIGTAVAQSAQQELGISASVPRYCAIAGTATPAAINTTIPISAFGKVDTKQQTFTVANVVCNSSIELVAQSVNGGVKSASKAGTGFTNFFNYRGSAQFGKATSTINSAKQKTATGPETGNVAATSKATRGSLIIRIRPAQPALPLVSGTDYNDTLRITLTPN